MEGCPHEKKIPYGDLDFLKKVYESIGSSVRIFFAKCWGFQKFRLNDGLSERKTAPFSTGEEREEMHIYQAFE